MYLYVLKGGFHHKFVWLSRKHGSERTSKWFKVILSQNLRCPICDTTDFVLFLGGKDLLECKKCGIVFDHTSSLGKKFYEHERVSSVDKKKLRARKRNVLQRVKLCSGILEDNFKVLDIGCGEGFFLKELQRHVSEVQGLEPTIKYVEYAKNELGLNVQQGLIEDANFPPQFFDVITIFHVLEHLENPNEALMKISSWLRPGGYLVIEVPNIKSPTAVYRGLHWELIIPEHCLYFSPSALSFLLNRVGFRPAVVRSRDFDQYHSSIGKSLRKLGLVLKRPHKAKVVQIKSGDTSSPAPIRLQSSLRDFRKKTQLPLKAFLGWIVLKFNRGDHLFVISQKTVSGSK